MPAGLHTDYCFGVMAYEKKKRRDREVMVGNATSLKDEAEDLKKP